MKKIGMMLLILGLLVGCSQSPKKTEDDSDTVILPAQKDGDYALVTPFQMNPLRQDYAHGFREVDVMEIGHRLYADSQQHFPTNRFQIKEGSIINADRYLELMGRNHSEKNPLGLNLERDTTIQDGDVTIKDPVLVSDLYEMNFVQDGKIKGISVSLVLKRMQILDASIGNYVALSDKVLFEAGSEIGRRLEATMRGFEGAEQVPIYISLYAQQSDIDHLEGNYLPGNVIGSAFYNKPRNGQFEKSDEQWLLLTSERAVSLYPNVTAQFNQFRTTLTRFIADESMGVVGKIFIRKNKIEELVIEINTGNKTYLELYGSAQKVMAELDRFTEFTGDITVNMKIYKNTRIVINRSGNKPATLVELR